MKADVTYDNPKLGLGLGDATILLQTLENYTFTLRCNTETGIRVHAKQDSSKKTTAPEAEPNPNPKDSKILGKTFESFEQLLRQISPMYGVKFDESLCQGILEF